MQKEIPFERLPQGMPVVTNALLCDYTTFRLGGSCPALLDCRNAAELAEAVRVLSVAGLPFLVIGQGSNLLVSDDGIESIVLRYCSDVPDVEFSEGCVTVSGSTLLDALAEQTIRQGVGDLAFCSGIPGTVGGAIVGNAGAFGRQIGDVVERVVLLQENGEIRTVDGMDLEFSYRSSKLKQTGEVVLSADLRLEPMDKQPLVEERERIMALRRSKHPDWRETPSAGSVFRNVEPTSAAGRRQAAGWFLEEAGGKSLRVGGARLFEGHANIIVTDHTATAMDVYELSEQMVAAVQKRFGFKLVREVRLLGAFR